MSPSQIQITEKRNQPTTNTNNTKRHEPLQIQITEKRHEPPTNTNNKKTTRTPYKYK